LTLLDPRVLRPLPSPRFVTAPSDRSFTLDQRRTRRRCCTWLLADAKFNSTVRTHASPAPRRSHSATRCRSQCLGLWTFSSLALRALRIHSVLDKPAAWARAYDMILYDHDRLLFLARPRCQCLCHFLSRRTGCIMASNSTT